MVSDAGHYRATYQTTPTVMRTTKASFAANGAIAQRYPELLREIIGAGHEIIAHSTDMNGTITSDLSEEAERTLITQALARLEKASGVKPTGWHSIARSQSWRTADLLAEPRPATHGIV